MNGFWVTFSNPGGVLERKFAKNEDTINDAVLQILLSTPLASGDVISVEEGWSEEGEDDLQTVDIDGILFEVGK